MVADPRPVALLNYFSRVYPQAWKTASLLRRERGRDGLPTWPDWCYLPLAGWISIAVSAARRDAPRFEDVYSAGLLAALGPWRYTQGIYRYHPAIYEALRDTAPQGDLPVDVLFRLPEWSVYIETPGLDWLGRPMSGYFAHLDDDAQNRRQELRLLPIPEDESAPCIPLILHLGPWTVTEAIDRMAGEAAKQGAARNLPAPDVDAERIVSMAQDVYPLVSLLLYLCSSEPEVVDPAEPGQRPARPRPKKVKAGWELFPAQRPRVWHVGDEAGTALEAARAKAQATTAATSGDTRNSPAAHVRRAHWHGYWTGALKEEAQAERPRRYQYRWLPPIIVGVGDDDA